MYKINNPLLCTSAKKHHTINLVNPGSIDHNTILRLYKEKIDPTLTWDNFTVAEQRAALAADRSNNILDTTLLQAYCREYNLPLPSIDRSIDCLLELWVSTTAQKD